MTDSKKRDLPLDIVEAEALARADESRASVFRRKGLGNQAYADAADAAAKDAKESSDHYEALVGERDGLPRDLSGVTRGLSDSAGNFASNVEVLTAGGTGIDASNTNSETGKPARNAAEAVAGGRIDIPASWEAEHWRTRVSLAEKISGRTNVKSDEANGIIAAELAGRA